MFKWKNPSGGFPIHLLTILALMILGNFACIRVAGTAGLWHQENNGQAPTSKQISFDTQNLVPQNKTPGNITV